MLGEETSFSTLSLLIQVLGMLCNGEEAVKELESSCRDARVFISAVLMCCIRPGVSTSEVLLINERLQEKFVDGVHEEVQASFNDAAFRAQRIVIHL